MKIKSKLLVITLVLALVPLTVVSYLSYVGAKDALDVRAFNQLEAIRTIKKAQLELTLKI